MKTKQREPATAPRALPPEIPAAQLDRPIYTLSVASEILETHPRTLMMYEHLNMIKPKRTVTNRRRYSQRDLMKLPASTWPACATSWPCSRSCSWPASSRPTD